jgi:hypothetical protein
MTLYLNACIYLSMHLGNEGVDRLRDWRRDQFFESSCSTYSTVLGRELRS